jgi:mycoredoxin
MPLELYGSRSCPYTPEVRAQLEWEGLEFVEYDVESDGEALRRLTELTEGHPSVPVLVENGRVAAVGWKGQSCYIGSAGSS